MAVLASLVALFGLTPSISAAQEALPPLHPLDGAPQNLTAVTTSASEITLDWLTTTGANTSTNGFIVSVRKSSPGPAEPIGSPKCQELWRTYLTPAGTEFATECVVDGLEAGAYYEIQVVETSPSRNSRPANAWSATFVPPVNNVKVKVDRKESGADILTTWDLPSDTKNITGSTATFYNSQDRAVWSCFRNVAQTGRCEFPEVVDGQYRVEVQTTGGAGSNPVTKRITVEQPPDPDPELHPSIRWHSAVSGEMFLNVSWNHIAESETFSYTASTATGACMARASMTPQRLNCDIELDVKKIAFPIAVTVEGGQAQESLQVIAPPPMPRNPTSTRATEINQNTALISWEHKGRSTATIYSVWIRDVAATCTVSPPFNGRESCRLEGLDPETTYTANVYAENAEGRRSLRTDRITFETSEPPVSDDPTNPCDEGEKYFVKRERALNRADRKFTKAVDQASIRFEDRPNKLAKKIVRLTRKRERRIAKAEAGYSKVCTAKALPIGPVSARQ